MNVAGLTDVDGVHVRAPAHFRGLRARGQIRRKLPGDNGVLGNFDVNKAHGLQFIGQEPGKVKLFGVTRYGGCLGVTLRGDRNVTQESFKQSFFLIHF